MKITVDTKEDSHEDIRKAIKILQNLIGDSQEIFTNQPSSESVGSQQSTASAFNNIFGDASDSSQSKAAPSETPEQTEETESTGDLFAELFSEEELKKMDKAEIKDDVEEVKPKGKKYDIELY